MSAMEGYGPPTGKGEKEVFLLGKVDTKPGYSQVTHHNEFDIQSSTIGKMAVGTSGPVDMEHKEERFEGNAKNTNVNLKDVNLTQPTFGGEATYNNESSDITAGGGGVGGSVGDWDYDVGKTILVILKKGVSLDLLYKALLTGKTIKELAKVVANLDSQKSDINLLFKSMLQATEDDMDTS